MTSKSVVLPAPFGPMRPTISPLSTPKETSSRTCRPPKRIEMPSTAKYDDSGEASVRSMVSVASVLSVRLSGIGAHRLFSALEGALELGVLVLRGLRLGGRWRGSALLLGGRPCHPFARVERPEHTRPERRDAVRIVD